MLRALPLVAFLAACGGSVRSADAPAEGGGGKADGVGLGLRLVAPLSARRGPTTLVFATGTAPVDPASLRLEVETTEGWQAASVFGPVQPEEEGLSVTWDSFRDAAFDGRVSLRLASGRGDLPFSVELRNAADTDRLVAVTQPLVPGTAGGATERGTGVGLRRWDGRVGAIVGDARRLEVDAGPRRVRASPDGRFLAVLSSHAHTITLLRTPLDADPEQVTVERSVQLPKVGPLDLAWSADSRKLLVAAMGDGVETSSLWAVDAPSDDGPFEWMEQVATLPGPPLKLVVDGSGRILVFCGSGGRGLDKLVLLDADGSELSRLEADMATPNALAFSPDGRRAVMTSTFYGDEVRLIETAGDVIAFLGEPSTAIASPFGALFHPTAPGIGLISQLDRNRATPFTLGTASLRAATPLTGLGLAGSLDLVERGPLAGSIIATGVAGSEGVLHVLRLDASGALSRRQEPVGLGPGAEGIPDGVALQR